jgi:hypothetical protein
MSRGEEMWYCEGWGRVCGGVGSGNDEGVYIVAYRCDEEIMKSYRTEHYQLRIHAIPFSPHL